MDTTLLRRLIDELAPALVGRRTERVFALPRYDLVIDLGSRRAGLWISVDPEEPHLCLRNTRPGFDKRPPAFAMAARKWGRGRKIESLELIEDDRVVRLGWNQGGSLVTELVPRRASAYVLDDHDVVTAVWNPRRGRPGIGELYSPPARSARRPVADVGSEDWRAFETADESDLRKHLTRSIHDMSPTLAREAIFVWQQQGDALRSAVEEVLQSARATPGPAVIYSAGPLDELRGPVDASKLLLWPTPLAHRSHACRRDFESLGDAATHYYDLRAQLRLLDRARRGLRKAIDDERNRLRRRVGRTPDQHEVAKRAAGLRRTADLLLANPSVRPVGRSVTVPNDYADGAPLSVSIDPDLDLAANARRLYDRAQRIEQRAATGQRRQERAAARCRLLDLLESAAAEMRTTEQVRTVLDRATELDLSVPLERLRDAEAGTANLLPEPEHQNAETLLRGILTVETREGHVILVGRSAAANDRLTHEVARPHDFWLHAEGPGSHVVLRNPRRLEQPPPDALAAAAALAAWFSKSRNTGKAEVHWTEARRVRRPRKGPPGLALLDSYHSFVVSPRAPADVGRRDCS